MTAACPPPWMVTRARVPPHRLLIETARRESVGLAFGHENRTGPGYANASLMAAAPELRDVVRELLIAHDANDGVAWRDAEATARYLLKRVDAAELSAI